jgi:hypothetical protein
MSSKRTSKKAPPEALVINDTSSDDRAEEEEASPEVESPARDDNQQPFDFLGDDNEQERPQEPQVHPEPDESIDDIDPVELAESFKRTKENVFPAKVEHFFGLTTTDSFHGYTFPIYQGETIPRVFVNESKNKYGVGMCIKLARRMDQYNKYILEHKQKPTNANKPVNEYVAVVFKDEIKRLSQDVYSRYFAQMPLKYNMKELTVRQRDNLIRIMKGFTHPSKFNPCLLRILYLYAQIRIGQPKNKWYGNFDEYGAAMQAIWLDARYNLESFPLSVTPQLWQFIIIHLMNGCLASFNYTQIFLPIDEIYDQYKDLRAPNNVCRNLERDGEMRLVQGEARLNVKTQLNKIIALYESYEQDVFACGLIATGEMDGLIKGVASRRKALPESEDPIYEDEEQPDTATPTNRTATRSASAAPKQEDTIPSWAPTNVGGVPKSGGTSTSTRKRHKNGH